MSKVKPDWRQKLDEWICRKLGHSWEAKSYSVNGFAAYWQCSRCKRFHYFSDERMHKP